MTAFILALFMAFVSPAESGLLLQSQEQANYYLEQIEQHPDQGEAYWALAELYRDNPEIRSYIKDILRREYAGSDFIDPFLSNKDHDKLLEELALSTGIPDLLIAALLELGKGKSDQKKELIDSFTQKFELPTSSNGIYYPSLAHKILEEKAISESDLPSEQLGLLHFLILYNPDLRLIGKNYLNKVIENINGNYSSSNELKKSIYLHTLFRIYYRNNAQEEIYDIHQALLADSLLPNSRIKLYIYRLLEFSLYKMGYYDRTLAISQEHTVPLAKYLNDENLVISTLIQHGSWLKIMGHVKESRDLNLHILEEAEKHNVPIQKAKVLNNLGVAYLQIGEFEKYLDLQFRALEEAKVDKNYDHQLKILRNLSIYYRENNDKKSSLQYLKRAISLAEEFDKTDQIGPLYLSLATFHLYTDQNYSESKKYFEKAYQNLNSNTQILEYKRLLFEEGILLKRTGQPQEALANFEEIMSLSKSKNNNQYFEALTHMAGLYIQLGELEKAGNLVDEIELLELNQFNFEDIVKAKTVQANYYRLTGNSADAYEILEPAIERTIGWAKNSTDIQSGFWNIQPEFLDAFQLMADMYIEDRQTDKAVELLDRLKTINDASLYQNPMVKSSVLNDSELSQYQRLVGQLDALRKKQLVASKEQEMSIQTTIDQLSAQKQALDRKISRMISREPIEVDEVQRQLTGREMVLHVTELNNRYYMAHITRSDIHFKEIELDDALREQFTGAIQKLANGETDLSQLYRISKVLELQEIPSRIESLTLIPDSYLYQLPVDILPLTQPENSYSYGGTSYVVERFKTYYLTSLNDFRHTNRPARTFTWDFAGYGVSDFQNEQRSKSLVPLPYAKTEITTILDDLTNITRKRKVSFINDTSTERVFKETAPQARILHLATHSELSERDPLYSTIYMSSDADDITGKNFAGQIFAYELFELNLQNDLIMLNSCESGSGSYLQGSGVMGISRALQHAGASSLILNIWSVNDMMASDFAIEFYKHINNGSSRDEALREAKLHFLKNKNANPHYWGSYMLIGERTPLVEPHRETNIYFAASFMLFFITLASVSVAREWFNGNKKAA